ncbi:MAG: hypothetical protein WCG83_03890 [Candidatus Peregrinibacteria bacterium]
MSPLILPNGFTIDDRQVRSCFLQKPYAPPPKQLELLMNAVCLRDGAQAAKHPPDEKEAVAYAQELVRFGIQGIEAGNVPAQNNHIRAIAERIGSMSLPKTSVYGIHPRISAFARLVHEDIVQAMQSVRSAPNRGVHTYMSHSQVQYPYKFDGLKAQHGLSGQDFALFIEKVVLPTIDREFKFIKDADPECHLRYSPEDVTRSDPWIIQKVILKAAESGVDCINLPDTAGISNPWLITEFVHWIRTILDEAGYPHVTIAFHGHNDITMAVANSMGAVLGGATEIDVTTSGRGERLGNTSVEGFLLMIDTQRAFLEQCLGAELIDPWQRKNLVALAEAAAEAFHGEIPDEAPVVSQRSNQQCAGVHVDTIRKARLAGDPRPMYAAYNPETYGARTSFFLNALAGRSTLMQVLEEMGLPFRNQDTQEFAKRMRQAFDQRTASLDEGEIVERIYDPTIIALTGGPYIADDVIIHPDKSVEIHTSDGQTLKGIPAGGAAIDATIHALRQLTPNLAIEDFGGAIKPANKDQGSAAPDVSCAQLHNGISVTAHAEHTDTERAGVLAVIKAFNALWARKKYAQLLKNTD